MKLSEIGLQKGNSPNRINKIRLTNTFAVFSFLVFSFNGIVNYYLKDIFSGILLICFGIFCLFTILFNYIHQNKIAVSYLFSINSFGIFYFDSYAGLNSGTYLYYFLLLLGIANVFDVRTKKDRNIVFSQVSILIILAIINSLTNHTLFENHTLSEQQKLDMLKSNIIIAIISMSYFIYLIIKSNISKLELLENLVGEENKLHLLEKEKNQEKEILLAELQHRLKNNLSIIASIIKLKNEKLTEENILEIQNEIMHAIQTIAAAHHLQKFNQNLLIIPIQDFLKKIIENLHFNNAKIHLSCSNDNFELQIKQALPLGLLIHETIFLFHTLNKNQDNHLTIEVIKSNNYVQMNIDCSIPNMLDNSVSKNILLFDFADQNDCTIQKITEQNYSISFKTANSMNVIESQKLFT
ncbi:MAG: sensor histidine kinase [Flavobacteriia bacterium]|nr:sensor histidine kinase [Flavobacteriia bacterium]